MCLLCVSRIWTILAWLILVIVVRFEALVTFYECKAPPPASKNATSKVIKCDLKQIIANCLLKSVIQFVPKNKKECGSKVGSISLYEHLRRWEIWVKDPVFQNRCSCIRDFRLTWILLLRERENCFPHSRVHFFLFRWWRHERSFPNSN
jgi:hypothetical protein